MPLAADPINFTWSLPSLAPPCTHGVAGQDEDFRGEFFQKIKETKTTLDRIYLSSLLRNKEKSVIYDYEKWARKGGKLAVKKPDVNSQSSALITQSRPVSGPVRALGVDERKIEAALHCGLWDDVKPKKNRRHKTIRMPHIMSRAQFYDLDDDYVSGRDELGQRGGAAYDLDSSKVFRVLQEENGAQANERLKKGKCGSWKRKHRVRRISPTKLDHGIEAEDDFASSEFRITIEEKHSQRRGDIVMKTTHKQKLDFSTIKKRGVAQSDTIEYRLPKLNTTPIIIEEDEHISNEDLLKLPLLVDVKRGSSEEKKKGSKHCKKRSKHRRKKKSGGKGEGDDSSVRLNVADGDDNDNEDLSKSEANLDTPRLNEVSSKLSNIAKGRTDAEAKKANRMKISCRKTKENEGEDDPLTEYPFMTMGIDGSSDTDDECLCDECLARMTSKKQPKSSKTPIKSILSPRRGKRTASSGSSKSVSFAETDDLEEVRLISPLAVRNENARKYEDEERRERLKERDIKRRERRQRERERFAALNKKPAKNTKERKDCVHPDPTQVDSDASSIKCDGALNDANQSENDANIATDEDNNSPTHTASDQTTNLHDSEDPQLSQDTKELENGTELDDDITPPPNPEVREVEALMLDPQDGRLYEDIVLEKGDGKITVAQLGYRIKTIFNRDLPPPACPKLTSSPSDQSEVIDQEIDPTPEDDELDDKDKPFVTKCVDWQETTESASTSRSVTPVEKQDMSDFIMSMRNCRYIRWSKSYADMLEKMEQ